MYLRWGKEALSDATDIAPASERGERFAEKVGGMYDAPKVMGREEADGGELRGVGTAEERARHYGPGATVFAFLEFAD